MAAPRLRHHTIDLHLRHTFRIARGASDTRRNVIVELEAEGHTGLGEAAPIRRSHEDPESAAAALDAIAPRLSDTRAFSQLGAELAVKGQRSAEAALDLALHDLAGKRLGAPLYELLGIRPGPTPVTSFTIGLDTPEIVAEKVKAASVYDVLKVKMGSDDDREVLEAVRANTKQRIRVDANEGWTPDAALERLPWLQKIGVEFIEQPLPADRIEDTRWLRARSPLPFYADESVHTADDIPKLAGAFDGINIKLMKCGGLAEALRMIAVARAHGMKVMLGCMIETSIGITAAAHLSPLVDAADLDGHLLISDDPYEGVKVVDGRLVLPDGPGLGVIARK